MKLEKSKISDILTVLVLMIILLTVYINKTSISSFVVKQYVVANELQTFNRNDYSKKESYAYVQLTKNYTPKNKQELYNLFYTIFNSGWTDFEFYCKDEYADCVNDIKSISNDGTLNYLNNYVHPYNSYKSVNISINSFGIIHVKITKQYSDYEIQIVENKINDLIKTIITSDMDDYKKILTFHDYIVNNTVYDSAEADLVSRNISVDLESYKAYNVLVNNIGLCGGYADTLAIFLTKMGYDNYKISTSNHVWNVVKLDSKWYHIDMTWDDPVTPNNVQHLLHDYFLIDTNELLKLNDEKHIFDQNVYLELKQPN